MREGGRRWPTTKSSWWWRSRPKAATCASSTLRLRNHPIKSRWRGLGFDRSEHAVERDFNHCFRAQTVTPSFADIECDGIGQQGELGFGIPPGGMEAIKPVLFRGFEKLAKSENVAHQLRSALAIAHEEGRSKGVHQQHESGNLGKNRSDDAHAQPEDHRSEEEPTQQKRKRAVTVYAAPRQHDCMAIVLPQEEAGRARSEHTAS